MAGLLNKKAPDFNLQDQDEIERSLADYREKYVLLYFYPKDMTSGCTLEAQGFRDMIIDLQTAGLQVLGVSADSCESHARFAKKESLNFPILADIERKVAQAYGVWVEKSMYGKKYMGIQRDSFLIDPKGVVVKHYVKVKPEDHPQEVLGDLFDMKR